MIMEKRGYLDFQRVTGEPRFASEALVQLPFSRLHGPIPMSHGLSRLPDFELLRQSFCDGARRCLHSDADPVTAPPPATGNEALFVAVVRGLG